MQKRYVLLICAVVPLVAFGQNDVVRVPGAVYDFDFKHEKSAPAPRRPREQEPV